MSRRKRGKPVHGVVLLDKPSGLSSNQALQKVRRAFDARKAGHTGTLDPFATGMLPLCLGEATKTAAFMLDAGKAYRATLKMGEATATGDPEGEVVHRLPVPELSRQQIGDALQAFSGDIQQVPPMYSALKVQGRPLYEWARKGVEIERPARSVTIYSMRLLSWNSPVLEFEISCSKGTYIRTLGEDIARHLGTCAHLTALRRLYVEPFEDLPLVTLEAIEALAGQGGLLGHLLPLDAGLAGWPEVQLDEEQALAFDNGNPVYIAGTKPGWVRVRNAHGLLLGLAECTPNGRLQPRRVMRYGRPDEDPENCRK